MSLEKQPSNQTLGDAVQGIIEYNINKIPQAEVVKIVNVNDDFVDIITDDDNVIRNIPYIASNVEVNKKGILLPLKNDNFYFIGK